MDYSALQRHKVASQGGDSSTFRYRDAKQSSGLVNDNLHGTNNEASSRENVQAKCRVYRSGGAEAIGS